MSDPARVVVDFDGARLATPRNTVASDYEPVQRVRLGQSRPDQVRVVIDLDSPREFSVDLKDQALTVAFSDGAKAVAAKSADCSPSPSTRLTIRHFPTRPSRRQLSQGARRIFPCRKP